MAKKLFHTTLLLLGIFFTSIAHAGNDSNIQMNENTSWQGNWASTYGQLRLFQSGSRVYGDYHVRGIISGKVSKDGQTLRGIFTYTSGRWGTFEFRKSTEGFIGSWRWEAITAEGDKTWQATRSSDTPDPLHLAKHNSQFLPIPSNDAIARKIQQFINFEEDRMQLEHFAF